MAIKSGQRFIRENRKPRVHIEYEVETYGSRQKVELPFVMGVMSDLSGKSLVEKKPADQREFVEIDMDNFDQRLEAIAPRAAFAVDNTLTGEGKLAVDLTFRSMNEFSPGEIARKVEPLARALEGRQAWMSGVRRVEAPSRARTQIAHLDIGRGIVKINPVANWTDDDIATYKRDHELLEHPLVAQGYPSIGCWPCTRAVAPGEDPRSGRWAATGKTECGLHGWPQP